MSENEKIDTNEGVSNKTVSNIENSGAAGVSNNVNFKPANNVSIMKVYDTFPKEELSESTINYINQQLKYLHLKNDVPIDKKDLPPIYLTTETSPQGFKLQSDTQHVVDESAEKLMSTKECKNISQNDSCSTTIETSKDSGETSSDFAEYYDNYCQQFYCK